MPVAVVALYRKTARSSFNALVGAMETDPALASVPVHFAQDASAMIAAIEAERAEGRTALVCWSFYSPEVFEIVTLFETVASAGREGVIHLAGGVHASAEPAQTLSMGFDLVAVGEGETTFIELLKALDAGGDPRSVRGISWLDDGWVRDRGRADSRPLDAYPSFAMAHGRFGPVEITRGCIYACRFCQTPYVFKARFRHRSVDSVREHARYLRHQRQRDLRFLTPTSLSYGSDDERPRLDQVEALLRAARDELGPDGRVYFGSFPSEVRPEHVTREAVRMLRPLVANDALLIGGQSGSQRVLEATRRGHSVESIVEAAAIAREGGFVPHVDFLFGTPGENDDDARASRSLMESLVALGAKVHAHTFLPLPGTPLRDADPGVVDPSTALALERLASQQRAYGQWRRQEQLASQLVSLRPLRGSLAAPSVVGSGPTRPARPRSPAASPASRGGGEEGEAEAPLHEAGEGQGARPVRRWGEAGILASMEPQLPPFEALDGYWKQYLAEVDASIEENFWGNLGIVRKARLYGDPYVAQLEAMGYRLDEGDERPAPFYDCVRWVERETCALLGRGELADGDLLRPAKAFAAGERVLFVPFGAPVPAGARPLNLLSPDVFARMLSEGFFPMGEAEREHTNQSLAEHDLAHMAGFLSQPRYMKAIRQAFRQVHARSLADERVRAALAHHDSLYSLRLYYTVEVFTEVPAHNRQRLSELLGLPLDRMPERQQIQRHLRQQAERPVELMRRLSRLYGSFHRLVNALGGESRDMLNRRRKFHRGDQLGSFYDQVSRHSSKFTRNSIWSLFLNANRALENKRSNHSDFLRSLDEIHTPLVGALIGTAQLDVEDWVLPSAAPVLDRSSKLYAYLHDSGLWDDNDLLHLAFCSERFDQILEDLRRPPGG